MSGVQSETISPTRRIFLSDHFDMDPSPPRKPKPASGVSPFYLKQKPVKTPAEIVSEAKEELLRQQGRDKVRSITTKRPFTPRDDQRTLFGGYSANFESRPASSFSVGSQLFDGYTESRPGSAARPPSGSLRPLSGTRLAPINDDTLRDGLAPKPPPDPNRKRSGRGSRSASHQRTVDQSNASAIPNDQSAPRGGSAEHGTPRSGSCGDLKAHQDSQSSRRVHSGPKERTLDNQISSRANSGVANRGGSGLGERGIADGKECSSREGSASTAVRMTEDQSYQWLDTEIQPIIDELSQNKLLDDDKVYNLCQDLYNKLDQGHMLGKVCSRRSQILRTLFKLMDRTEPRVLLCLSRLILALRVSGSNLTSCCKLIFKVSKDKDNDRLFLTDNLLEIFLDAMSTMDSGTNHDALVYSCGAVKFLASNSTLSEILSQKCTLLTLKTILNRLNKQNLDSTKPAEKLVQILSQITSVLRRFAENAIFTSQFIYHSIIDELCITSVTFASEYDIMLNLSSIFSKLTIHEECCEALHKHPSCYKSILKILQLYTHREDIVLRLCFVLGNLAALNEEARISFHGIKSSLQTIVHIFEHYLTLNLKVGSESSPSGDKSNKRGSQINEVLIKVIRVIANLSMSEQVGGAFSDESRLIELMTHITEVKDISVDEELVLTTLTTINNLSYYCSPGTALQENEIDISKVLLNILREDHREALLEACRIYGNLTRSRTVRDYLSCHSVVEIMITLLDSGEQELVFNCCGVLVNFMCDEDKRPVMKREGGINKLIEVLNDFATADWQLAGLVCQLLWNYSAKLRNSIQTFGERQAQQLIDFLNIYIDDPNIPETASHEMMKYLRESWTNDFCSVAAQLRKRIKSHMTQLEPLDAPA